MTRRTAGLGVDGRVLIIGAVVAYAAAVAIAHVAWHVDLWPHLGVNSAPTLFFDARNVAAASDCWALGYDPLVENPCDPAGRVMNYPRVWVLLHFLGLTQERTLLFGAIAVALFFATLLLLIGRLSLTQGAVTAIAVISPAVMLAVERGNMDLLLFVIFVLAVFAWQARDRLTPMLSPALVLAAAIAKLYAVFALPAFVLTGERRARWAAYAGVVVMALYLVVTFRDFRVVMRAPEGGLLYSYGARILIGHLYHQFSPAEWLHGSLLAQVIAMIPVLMLSAAAWVWARRRLTPLMPSERVNPKVLAFHLGALTYLGTFLTRKSGDYRLIFLLLTLPLLLEWGEGSRADLRTMFARGGLIAVLAGLWVGALSPFIGPWDELGSWAIALMFVALLAATVPRWLRPRAPEPGQAAVPAGEQAD